MNLLDIIKIAAIACSCRNRARALLSDNELLDDETVFLELLYCVSDCTGRDLDFLSYLLECPWLSVLEEGEHPLGRGGQPYFVNAVNDWHG